MNRGSDLRIKVKLNLNEISTGAEKRVKVKKYTSCEACNGTGAKDGTAYETCSTCRGSGHVTRVTNTFLGQMQTTTTCPPAAVKEGSFPRNAIPVTVKGILPSEETISFNIPAGVSRRHAA